VPPPARMWSAEGIMASGHVNRANRPNTWLHRPLLQKAVASPRTTTKKSRRSSRSAALCLAALPGESGRPRCVVRSQRRSGSRLSRLVAKGGIDRHREGRLDRTLLIGQRVGKESSRVELWIGQRLLERSDDRAAAIAAGKDARPVRGRPAP